MINASGFIATHALSVTVGGVTAPITSGGTTDASGNATVHFTIPSVATGTQAVVVSDGTNSATSPTGFSVSAVSPPAVSGLSPTSGPVGTAAVINASGFIATHALTVTVGGVTAPITSGGTTDASGNATVHFTIPSVATGTQAVVVSDGTNSATSPTGFSVSAASATNVAPLATVTASSQNTSTGQLATKAVDGSTLGYPTDYTHEWATVGQKSGAWLNLAWSSPQTLSSITLYDRPNLNDQVTGGTITFSDGSSVSVGVLPNDGSPLTLSFAAKTVTSLRFTITAVSSTTQNIGLAEIQAYTGGSAPAPAVSGLSPTSGPVGTAAVINASGFIATHALTVTVGGVTAPITSGGTTDASGNATVHFTIPECGGRHPGRGRLGRDQFGDLADRL